MTNGTATAVGAQLPKGHTVQFFHEAEVTDQGALLVKCAGGFDKNGPQLVQSHGWLEGKLAEAFDPSAFDAAKPNTWPLVSPHKDISFTSRTGKKPAGAAEPQRVRRFREPSAQSPLLSLVLVRWNGTYSKWMDETEENDGDWGQYGSPPSDEYMTALVKMGVLGHPRFNNDERSCEIFHLFVKSSQDVLDLIPSAPWLASRLRGRKKTCFWMLWPAEWEDTGDPDFACYIERQAFFAGMRACEAVGLLSGFPHPSDQFELITSKSWMASLCLHPGAYLPAAVLVNKGHVVHNAQSAARDALTALEHIRRLNPFPVGPGEPAAPSVINKDGVHKGVVKLGWSWENRFVAAFNGAKELQSRLAEMMGQSGCTASYCVVQEWVDFDFEMRLYILPPRDWQPAQALEPVRIECNEWGERSKEEAVGVPHASFRKLSEAACLTKWSQDAEAWAMAKTKAIQIAQLLVAWLRTMTAQPVPMIRLDFMLKRLGPGKARVTFGEYCEMGACCLGWKEGPPTIWRAAIDAVTACDGVSSAPAPAVVAS